jgi:opacity protein-like surface antigen
MRLRQTIVMSLLLGPLVCASARAETVLTPSVGRVFGGDLDTDRSTYGLAIGFMGDSPLGFEVDFSYTPDFFGRTATTSKNNQVTLMANLLLSARVSDMVRLYGTGGAGIMKSRVEDVDPFFDVDQNDFGVNAGGGILVKLGRNFGVRGDVRYFRDVQSRNDDLSKVDFGDLNYWRGSAGVTLRF